MFFPGIVVPFLGSVHVSGDLSLNPKPLTLNPKPQTLNPKPQTLNPKPQTRNPKLYDQDFQIAALFAIQRMMQRPVSYRHSPRGPSTQ